MSDTVIQTHGLTRVYGQKMAVNQINLTVLRGSVTALIVGMDRARQPPFECCWDLFRQLVATQRSSAATAGS